MKKIIVLFCLLGSLSFAGIFDAPQKTDEEIKKDAVIEIAALNSRLNGIIKSIHSQIFLKVWCNGYIVKNEQDEDIFNYIITPQEVFTTYGTDAYKLFQISGGLQQILYVADPTYTVLIPPKQYVINEDGTITVGEENPEGYQCK